MSSAITYVDGQWVDANAPLWSSVSHGVWLSSMVFDGARAFEGVTPDLDLHCQRTINSANALGLRATKTAAEIEEIAREGMKKFASDEALYIRPLFWADDGFVAPNPDSTRFALTLTPMAMPGTGGFSACLSTRRRPMPDAAPTDAKASCLYPNAGRALLEARGRGFDNCVMLDPMGNVAEFATANLFIAKDGVIKTPAINGSFLNGITRQRVMKLLRDRGETVVECRLTADDVYHADEIFNTGNYGKVMPVIRYEDRDLQPGPKFNLARELYWEFSHGKAS
ncbi:MAG: branched-chain amino acid aminotransferase [Alphaproteobacteria bacterium]|nr:branched-chain amino acid aminotransferase [Alphaproteobacteria bacterium]